MKIETITPDEAAKRLRSYGMRISPETIRDGLRQGVYPFGIYIQHEGGPVYQIFVKQFNQWCREVGEEE